MRHVGPLGSSARERLRAVAVLALCVLSVEADAKPPARAPVKAPVHAGRTPVKAPPPKSRVAAVTPVPRAKAPAATGSAVDHFGRGARLVMAASYAAAQQELTPIADAPLANRDALLYFLATSEAMTVPPARAAALQHFRELAAMQQSRYARLGRARVADLLFDLGRFDEARTAYYASLAAPTDEVDPAVARFRLAELSVRANEKAAAVEGYRKVWVEFPSHPLADRALQKLRALDASAADSLGARERIVRAQKLTNDHQWQRALDELNAIQGTLSPSVRDEVDYWLGTIHFKMRHGYDLAAQKLLDVWPRLPSDKQAEALFHGSRAWSRADPGDDDKAIAGYEELLRRFPRSKQASEAAFLVGWLDFNRGRYKEALPGLERCLDKYGSSAWNDDARWYHGFAKWMLGDTAGALVDFELLSRHTESLEGGKGRYWKGRALAKLGRSDEAVDAWRKLVADYPLSWYASLARVALREAGKPTAPFGDGEARSTATAPGPVDEKLAADADVARVDELLHAGLPVEAAVALDRVDGALVSRYGAVRAVPLLMDRYRKAEDFFHLHRLGEKYSGGALRKDPSKDPAARAWWQAINPLAYQRFVEKYGPSGKNPTYYLYTIMQKESAYNPHDLSYADAIGLLQMIPPTSRRVAEHIGRPYTDDVLYDPEGNVQFGAWYIGHLLEKFRAQVPLGAGSFNAGPKAMIKWIAKNGQHPLDEFVELCSYTQTREYMKKVTENYARYR